MSRVIWNSLEELRLSEAAFSKLMHVLLGLYVWELATSIGFDLDIFKGKKKFRWPLIFYFFGRYALLLALVGIIISLNVTVEINCQAVYIFIQIFGNMSIGVASINLSLRTIAVWSRSIYVVVPIVCLILGHWSLLLHGLLIKATWVPAESGCEITNTNNVLLAATFIYSMAFDFLILILTGYKLAFPLSFNRVDTRSTLVKMVFDDGLIFFIVAFLANLTATIFMLIDLNAVMSVIFNVPAAVASTIVASRAVRRLSNFIPEGPEVFHSSKLKGALWAVFWSIHGSLVRFCQTIVIQMDTFVPAEIPTSTNTGSQSFLEYDEQGQINNKNSGARADGFDFEAQTLSPYCTKASLVNGPI